MSSYSPGVIRAVREATVQTSLETKISADEAAERIGITPKLLGKLRHTGEGPPFFKIGGRKIVYSAVDVEAWLANRRMTKTPGGPGGRPRKDRASEPQHAGV